MRVEDILKTKGNRVVTARGSTDVFAAVKQLRREAIGALVVTDDDGHVDGVLSERDVVNAVAQHREAALDRTVGDVMSRAVVTCRPTDPVKHVMEQMTRRRMRHLPVVDDDDRLCGIVSIGDVVKSRLDELEMEGAVLRDAYLTRR